MATTTISASAIWVKPWNKQSKLSPRVALELSVAGLHCTCFDPGRASEFQDEKEVRTDLLSTVLPAGLHLVRDPLGNTREAYEGSGLLPVLNGNQSVATYLIDEFVEGTPTATIQEQINALAINDPCCDPEASPQEAGKSPPSTGEKGLKATKGMAEVLAPMWGGKTCSRVLFRADHPTSPLTFHLQLDDVWEGKGPPAPGILATGLDHFLIPSKTPGNSVVWLAIPRSEDPRENFEKLKAWEKNTHRFAAFDGIMYTSDTLKISIVLDATPAG